MAQVKLNLKGKGSGSACYRNKTMSPPACHDRLQQRRLAPGLVVCRMVKAMEQRPIDTGPRQALFYASFTLFKMKKSHLILYCIEG